VTHALWQVWIADTPDPEAFLDGLGLPGEWTIERDPLMGLRAIGIVDHDQLGLGGVAESLWWTLRVAKSVAGQWTVEGPFESGNALVTFLEGHRYAPGVRAATIHLRDPST
jgi:hypothetical protein